MNSNNVWKLNLYFQYTNLLTGQNLRKYMDKDSEIRTFFANFLHIISKHFIYLIMFAFFSPQKKREKKRKGKTKCAPKSFTALSLLPACTAHACPHSNSRPAPIPNSAPDIPAVNVQRSIQRSFSFGTSTEKLNGRAHTVISSSMLIVDDGTISLSDLGANYLQIY